MIVHGRLGVTKHQQKGWKETSKWARVELDREVNIGVKAPENKDVITLGTTPIFMIDGDSR